MTCKIVAAASLGLVMVLVAWSSLRQSEAQAQVAPEKQVWEYKVAAFVVDDANNRNVDRHEKEINSLAAEGWEYVGLLCAGTYPYHSATPTWISSGGNVLFKRPKK
ncbi:MAG: DUF4177 domain-containing protein [Pirellulaceae bacterium]